MANRATSGRERQGAVAIACAGLGAACAYVIQRGWDRAIAGPVDPVLILRESHTAYVWRAIVATWWGVTVGLAARALVREDRIERAERILSAIAIPLAAILATAAAVWP